MNKPVVGIVSSVAPDPADPSERQVFTVGKPYIDRILEAGGVPLIVPHGLDAADVLELIDGWMIIGGRDIDPELYGQTQHPKTEVEAKERFFLEKDLFDHAPEGLPVLGICYGCQFLNIARGGDLIQHLPDVVGHGSHSGGTTQSYAVDDGTLTAATLGCETVEGRSYHHQAISHVGKGLVVTARSEDGTIEAVEDEGGRWILGLQWHPERTPENDSSRRVFREFVAQARAFKERKGACGTW